MNRFQVRRATVEDLPQLRTLWQMENLPEAEFEKRFTEFQVALDAQGEILATVGLQMLAGQGKIYGEAIGRFDLADELRAMCWPRLETLARNQGLSRLWTTQEAVFWRGLGFKKATDQNLAEMPAGFTEENAQWFTLPLRASGASVGEVERQLAALRVLSQAENERVLERAKVLKWIAMGVLGLVFALFALWVLSWWRVENVRRKRR